MAWQRTIARSVTTEGIGVHSGVHVALALHPAPADTGIRFLRSDLGATVPARADSIRRSAWATTLGCGGVHVSTVEHALAALAQSGISNAVVELSGPEVPILDGSAAPFVELVASAGVVEQDRAWPEIRVRRTVRVADGDRWIELRPGEGCLVDYAVHYASPLVGRQRFVDRVTPRRFATAIAPARTFTFLEDVTAMKAAGLARGGSVDNCVLIDGTRVLSGELRFPDELVRHKVLDLLGDLALLEHPLHAEVVARKAGHTLHLALVRTLLATPEAWELVDAEGLETNTLIPFPAAEAELG